MFRTSSEFALTIILGLHGLPCWGQIPDNLKDRDWFVPSVDIAKKLNNRSEFNGYGGAELTLERALGELSKRYGLTFVLNREAFKKEGLTKIQEIVIPGRPIGRMHMVSPSIILRIVLSRIPVKSRATFVISKSWVEVTTRQEVLQVYWPQFRELTMSILREIMNGRVDAAELVQLVMAAANLKAALVDRVLSLSEERIPTKR